MIPAKEDLTVVDNLEGEEIAFGIGDARWVMQTQAELYSDVVTAIIREYSTNAFDANVMAGNPDPIQVTLPSMFNDNKFIVEDKGVGMDIETFRKVYTQFGISDKRESMDTNGMLGYGSKSGVAYTTSFEVMSVKDGIKIHGIVMRKPDWDIVLKILSTKKTDEPNGTRITIPVHEDIDGFNQRANDFYKYWMPGRVVIDGEPSHQYVGQKIVDGLYFSSDQTSRIVMGNVAYRIQNPSALFYNTKMRHINFVAYVDNGDVQFTPSREDLKYTDKTKATLQKVVKDFEASILKVSADEVKNAKDAPEAFVLWRKWKNLLGANLFGDLTYNGQKLTDSFPIHGTRTSKNGGRGNTYRITNWSVDSDSKTIYVTEFAGYSGVSYSQRQKVNDYAKHVKWDDYAYIVFTASKADEIVSPWIAKEKCVTWETVKRDTPKPPRPPRAPRSYSTGRPAGSWDFADKHGRKFGEPIPLTKGLSLYYVTTTESKNISALRALQALDWDNSIVITVPANRLAKFQRDYKNVKRFTVEAQAAVIKDGSTLLSDEAKASLSIDGSTESWCNKFSQHGIKIEDPRVATILDLASRKNALTAKYYANVRLANMVGLHYGWVNEWEPSDADQEAAFKIETEYPLLDRLAYWGLSSENAHELGIYINAAYHSRKDSK